MQLNTIFTLYAQIFAHNVQICAKFCCKNFSDVCQILCHYTSGGGHFCEHVV